MSTLSIDPYAHFLSSQRAVFNAGAKRAGYDIAPDRGHPFENLKWEYLGKPITGSMRSAPYYTWMSNALLRYRPTGGSTPLFTAWHTGIDENWQTPELAGFAQRAYGEAAPSLAEFSLSEFFGEIREGLPKLLPAFFLKDKGNFFRSVGSDYLNVQFGWIPFISSLRDLATALARANYKVNAVEGVPLRRHWAVPRIQESREFPVVLDLANAPGDSLGIHEKIAGFSDNSNVYLNAGTGTALQTLESKRVFTGSYINVLPKSFDDSSYLSRLDLLLDTDITPAVLWQLAPWSWLTDWFLDIQGAINANELAVSDTVLTQYAYASERSVYRTVLTGNLSSSWGGDPKVSAVLVGTAYRRIRANPYGFSVGSFGGLNSHQMSILAALGLSLKR